MFTRIIVPLDGSDLAFAAIPYALTLAQAAHGSVTLLRAVPRRQDPVREEEELAQTEQALNALAGRLRAPGRQIEVDAIVGDPAAAIVRYAERIPEGLIAMTTHGHGGIAHWAFGSVARKVLTTATGPTLIVRPKEAPAHPERSATIRAMLVPLDGSERAEAALPLVKELTVALDARVTLARVVAIPPPAIAVVPNVAPPPAYLEQPIGEAWEPVDTYLQAVREEVAAVGVTAATAMPVGEAAEALLDLLRAEAYHLIIMTTHGRTGITRWTMGSVAERLVEGSHIPILLLRSADVAQ